MLGEKIGEERGKVTATRVLEAEGATAKVEVSFEAKGTILGFESTGFGTYSSVVRPSGVLYGQGQGVIMTKDGGTVSWTGNGIGKFTGHGSAVQWRGSVYYQTTSEKLRRLNHIVGVFEHETDENGNIQSTVYEWK